MSKVMRMDLHPCMPIDDNNDDSHILIRDIHNICTYIYTCMYIYMYTYMCVC